MAHNVTMVCATISYEVKIVLPLCDSGENEHNVCCLHVFDNS